MRFYDLVHMSNVNVLKTLILGKSLGHGPKMNTSHLAPFSVDGHLYRFVIQKMDEHSLLTISYFVRIGKCCNRNVFAL